MGLGRRLAIAAAGLPVVAAAVLAVEVQLARSGAMLDDVPLRFADGDGDGPLAVWMGDSTAAGVGVDRAEAALPALVAEARGERLRVLAVSGATVSDVLRSQLPSLGDLAAPARIYVSVGANDVTHLTRRDEFRTQYRRLLEALPPGVPVVLLGVPDMGAPPRLPQPLRAIAGHRGRVLDDVIADLADDHPSAVHVDIAGRTGPAFRRDPGRFFAADRYHPSDDGYRLWADAVLDAAA